MRKSRVCNTLCRRWRPNFFCRTKISKAAPTEQRPDFQAAARSKFPTAWPKHISSRRRPKQISEPLEMLHFQDFQTRVPLEILRLQHFTRVTLKPPPPRTEKPPFWGCGGWSGGSRASLQQLVVGEGGHGSLQAR